MIAIIPFGSLPVAAWVGLLLPHHIRWIAGRLRVGRHDRLATYLLDPDTS